jgi:hypothetical protein
MDDHKGEMNVDSDDEGQDDDDDSNEEDGCNKDSEHKEF